MTNPGENCSCANLTFCLFNKLAFLIKMSQITRSIYQLARQDVISTAFKGEVADHFPAKSSGKI